MPERRRLGYSRQSIAPEDVGAVREVLEGDWLTGGPALARFEESLASAAEMAGVSLDTMFVTPIG